MVDILKMEKLMNPKEVKRAQVLDLLKEDKVSQQEAARRMGVTPPARHGDWPNVINWVAWLDWSARNVAAPQTDVWMKPCA